MMPPPNQLSGLAERAIPLLNEFGLEGFVLFGYLADAGGSLRRVCIANTAGNPAFEDGLRQFLVMGQIWGASSASLAPNPDSPPKEAE